MDLVRRIKGLLRTNGCNIRVIHVFREANCVADSYGALTLMKMESPKGKAIPNEEELMPASDDRKIGKKDPNKPKRPTGAFFIFLEEFGKNFKEENPKLTSVTEVGRFGGEKWKSTSPAEKAPYEAKAAKERNGYRKLMDAYNKRVNVL